MSSKTNLLQSSFLKATPQDYWHYMMKEKSNESTYTVNKIQTMVKQITEKMGSNSFETPREHQWTPLHVAAIAGNRAGILFLKAQGVSLNPRDEYGKTPADYCTPDLRPLFERQVTADEKEPSAVPVPLPSARFHYWAPSDFGLDIRELLFTKPNDTSREMRRAYAKTGLKIDHFVSNLREVATEEGFRLHLSGFQYCVRDHWIRMLSGDVVLPSDSRNISKAIGRAQSLSFVKGDKASFCTDHDYFLSKLGATDLEAGKAIKDFELTLSHTQTLRFYIEGGNHFLVSNASGQVKLLLGADLFPIILNQCRLDKFFDDPMVFVDKIAQKLSLKLTLAEIRETLQEMDAQGLLKSGKGFLSDKAIQDIVEIHMKDPSRSYHEIARGRGYLQPLELTDASLEAARLIAARYRAQKEIILTLISRSFFGDVPDLSENDIVFIPQADYHLDTFMHPGPKGSMFLQDYTCCIATLETMQRGAKEFGLTDQDLMLIETRYLPTAQKLNRELGLLLQKAREKLEKAGFIVIPAPAVFYDVAPSRLSPKDRDVTFNLNFINSITGWSPKNRQYYYIAAGAEVGDKLGSAFMEVYRKFLDSCQKGIRVHFIGHDPKDPSKFAEAMRWFNRPGSQAGPHCFSFEFETRPHIA